MKSRTKKAIEAYKSGFNCAQSMISAYSDFFDIDRRTALALSCGFGGGMGKLQGTCGAVTGSFMVLGAYSYNEDIDIQLSKDRSVELVREFSKRFKAIHSTTNCKDIIGCDISTDRGMQYAKDNLLFETICEKCIKDSVVIIEDLINS